MFKQNKKAYFLEDLGYTEPEEIKVSTEIANILLIGTIIFVGVMLIVALK